MTLPRQPVPPEVVLGQPSPLVALLSDTVFLGVAGALALGLGLAAPSALPAELAPARDALRPLFATGFVVALLLVRRWARARSGAAELYADRLIVRPDVQRAVVVFLRDVLAFDDASADFVRVTSQDEARGRVVVSVATPREAARGQLLRALAAAGAAREEGQALAPAARAPSPVLLRVEGQGGHLERLVLHACLAAFLVAAFALQAVGQLWLIVVVGITLFGALVFAVEPTTRRRAYATFREDRVEIDPQGDPARPDWRAIGWDDLVGWSGAAPDYAHLLLRRGLAHEVFRVDPIVPTADPATRGAVEALLARRGVPRLDAPP